MTDKKYNYECTITVVVECEATSGSGANQLSMQAISNGLRDFKGKGYIKGYKVMVADVPYESEVQ